MKTQRRSGRAGLLAVGVVLTLAGAGCNDDGDRVPGPPPWQFSSPLPVPRSGHCACAVNDNIYVMGGLVESALTVDGVDDLFQYALARSDWQSQSPLPEERGLLGCSVVDGLIYVTGGLNHNRFPDTIIAYDPAQDTWQKKLDMPIGRGPNASVAVDGKIYMVTDSTDEGIDNFFVYDPAQNTLEPIAPLLPALTNGALATVSGKVYAFGGYDGSAASSEVQEYDPATDRWVARAPMGKARWNATAVALGGRVYVIGGADGTTWVDTVEEYHPPTDTWTPKTSMNVARTSATAVALDDRLYVIGGYGVPNGSTQPEADLALVEMYDPAKDPVSR